MSGPPIKFGDEPTLTDKRCYSLLKKYMPLHVTENKILQQLFIKCVYIIILLNYEHICITYLGIWKEGVNF